MTSRYAKYLIRCFANLAIVRQIFELVQILSTQAIQDAVFIMFVVYRIRSCHQPFN